MKAHTYTLEKEDMPPMQLEASTGWKQDLLPLLPTGIVDLLRWIADDTPLEEIRIRANQPLQLCCAGYDRLLYAPGGKPAATAQDCAQIIGRITEHSLYAWQEELQQGFLTIPGGYRVGLSGRAVKDQASLRRLTEFTSLSIRIAREQIGCANALMPRIRREDGSVYPTLIISPPGCGKTTLLRDVSRQLSYGGGAATPGLRVCVVDERMELSGSLRGVAQYDLGPRTDVLSGCSKVEGIPLAVRVLSPQVIITDELGSKEDADAVQEAAFCGVSTIASAHVEDILSLRKRLQLMGLLYSGAFARVVLLGRRAGRAGEILEVFNGELQPLMKVGRGSVLCFEQ